MTTEKTAASVKGLETVGYVTTSPTGAEVFQRKPLVPGHGQFGYKQDAVVTRSQAEAIIGAMDQIIACHREAQVILGRQLNEVIADNEALTERIKELETERDEAIRRGEDQWSGWVKEEALRKALKTQLAVAKKALEDIAILYPTHTNASKIARAALGVDIP